MYLSIWASVLNRLAPMRTDPSSPDAQSWNTFDRHMPPNFGLVAFQSFNPFNLHLHCVFRRQFCRSVLCVVLTVIDV